MYVGSAEVGVQMGDKGWLRNKAEQNKAEGNITHKSSNHPPYFSSF